MHFYHFSNNLDREKNVISESNINEFKMTSEWFVHPVDLGGWRSVEDLESIGEREPTIRIYCMRKACFKLNG